MIFAVFDFKVTPILRTKFPVNWPFGPGKEVQNTCRFSRMRPLQPSWTSDQKDFRFFFIYKLL